MTGAPGGYAGVRIGEASHPGPDGALFGLPQSWHPPLVVIEEEDKPGIQLPENCDDLGQERVGRDGFNMTHEPSPSIMRWKRHIYLYSLFSLISSLYSPF